MNKLLEVVHLRKNYHTVDGEIEAIRDISLEVNEGEIIAIVGSSGCGKSSLLHILAGLEKKSGGEIIMRKDLSIGYMLQQDALFPWLTIMDNILLGVRVSGELDEEKKEYALRLLKSYDLEDFKDKYPDCLSGGMRQRVALIRTLVMEPDVILLDEAFSALDYQTRLAVSDDVYRMLKQEGKTAIIVTHDLAEAISMADRVIVFSKRPATIKKEYKIELTNKSSPICNRRALEFSEYYEMIWKDLDVFV